MIQDANIFKAIVDRVNLADDPSLNVFKGTIDCHSEIPRMAYRNVRVLSPHASTVYTTDPNNPKRLVAVQSGFVHLPNKGDLVICAFVNGYPDYPICMGSLYEAANLTQAIPQPEQATPTGVAGDTSFPPLFQRQDGLWMHESGAYIRMRNNGITPQGAYVNTVIPEITFHHSNGTDLTMTEDANGNVSVVLSAPNTTIVAGARNDASVAFVDPSDPTPAKTILKLQNSDEVLVEGPGGSMIQLSSTGIVIQTTPGSDGQPLPVYIGSNGQAGGSFPVLYRKINSQTPIQDINEIGQSNVLFVGGEDTDMTQGNNLLDAMLVISPVFPPS